MAARNGLSADDTGYVYTHLHIFYDRIIPIDVLHIIAHPIQARLPVNSITGSVVEHNEYVTDCVTASHDRQLNGRALLNILDHRWKTRAAAYYYTYYRPPQSVGTAHRVIRLLLTPFDCFISGLTFVFGVSRPHSSCFVSLARLRGHAPLIITEVVHELGHVFGLRHCKQSTLGGAPCVMTRSVAVQHAMTKASTFCLNCQSNICKQNIRPPLPPLMQPMFLDTHHRAAPSSIQQASHENVQSQHTPETSNSEHMHSTSQSKTSRIDYYTYSTHSHQTCRNVPVLLPRGLP